MAKEFRTEMRPVTILEEVEYRAYVSLPLGGNVTITADVEQDILTAARRINPVYSGGYGVHVERKVLSSREVSDKLTDEQESEIAQLMRDGLKINAIKRVREITGWGLKESKDYVDANYDSFGLRTY